MSEFLLTFIATDRLLSKVRFHVTPEQLLARESFVTVLAFHPLQPVVRGHVPGKIRVPEERFATDAAHERPCVSVSLQMLFKQDQPLVSLATHNTRVRCSLFLCLVYRLVFPPAAI